ncbi:MAG: hypothetical protein U0132_23460 [Gemmatimonadaceae bacterium]
MTLKTVDRTLMVIISVIWVLSWEFVRSPNFVTFNAVSWCVAMALIVGHRTVSDRLYTRRLQQASLRARILTIAKSRGGSLTRATLTQTLMGEDFGISLESIEGALAELELYGLCQRDPMDVSGAECLDFPGLCGRDRLTSTEPDGGRIRHLFNDVHGTA